MNANKTILQNLINNRLMEYGYPYQTNPAKYNSYSAVRRTISLRLGLKEGRESLSDLQLAQAKVMLDEILPRKSKEGTDMNISKLREQLLQYSEVNPHKGMAGDSCQTPKNILAEAAGLLSDYETMLEAMQAQDMRSTNYDRLDKIWSRDYFRYLGIMDHCREVVTLHDAKKLKQLKDDSMIQCELMDLYILLSMYFRGNSVLEDIRLQKFLEKAEQTELPMSACNTAQRDSNGCLGYQYGEDDEPIGQCKKCPNYTGYEAVE